VALQKTGEATLEKPSTFGFVTAKVVESSGRDNNDVIAEEWLEAIDPSTNRPYWYNPVS
jgi:hypothetical protein